MPNSDVHIPAGMLAVLVMFFVYLGLGHDFPESASINGVLILIAGIIAGFLGAATPDTIEKPTSPHHRGFFHWVIGALFTFYLVLFFATAPYLPIFDSVSYQYLGGFVTISYISGYVSHFFLDLLTTL